MGFFFFFLKKDLFFRSQPPSSVQSVFLRPPNRQYLCCWNGSTTSGGQALYSILNTLKKKKGKKKSIRVHLSCISHSIVGLQWDLFSSGRFNTWAGQWKECNGVGWGEEGWGWGGRGGRGGGALWREEQVEIAEGRSNSNLKQAYPSSFLDFIIRYVWDNLVEWNKVILPPQKAKRTWSSQSALTWFQGQGSPAWAQECK